MRLYKLLREEGRHGQGAEITAGAMRVPKLQRVLLILAFHAPLGRICLTFLVMVNESKNPDWIVYQYCDDEEG